MWRKSDKNPPNDDAVDTLARFDLVCRIELSSSGTLRLRFAGPTMTQDHLHFVLGQVSAAENISDIVFDFCSIERIEGQWTAVVAEIIFLARRTGAVCRIESLHGQPAHVFALYRNSRELRSLMQLAKKSVGSVGDGPFRRAG